MMRRSKLISLMIIISTFMLLSTVTVSAKTVSEHEPNDSMGKANTFNIGDKVKGKIYKGKGHDEYDWFVFTAPESGKICLDIQVPNPSGHEANFDVYNDEFQELFSEKMGAGIKSPRCKGTIDVKCGKKYYVSVWEWYGDGNEYIFTTKYAIDKTKITKVKAKKTSAKVTWKKKNEASYYQIRYASPSSYSRFGWTKGKTIKASRNTSSKTITKLKKKHSYYVTVRVVRVVQGKTYYSGWSGKKLIKTKRK